MTDKDLNRWRLRAEEQSTNNPTGLVFTDGDVRVWVDQTGRLRSNYLSPVIKALSDMQGAWFAQLIRDRLGTQTHEVGK